MNTPMKRIAKAAREYLAVGREEDRAALRPVLDSYEGDFDAVVQTLTNQTRLDSLPDYERPLLRAA